MTWLHLIGTYFLKLQLIAYKQAIENFLFTIINLQRLCYFIQKSKLGTLLQVACPVCERKFKHKNTCTVHIKVRHRRICSVSDIVFASIYDFFWKSEPIYKLDRKMKELYFLKIFLRKRFFDKRSLSVILYEREVYKKRDIRININTLFVWILCTMEIKVFLEIRFECLLNIYYSGSSPWLV